METGRQNLLMVQKELVLIRGSDQDQLSGADDDLLNSRLDGRIAVRIASETSK
jgi:hypothetical protein